MNRKGESVSWRALRLSHPQTETEKMAQAADALIELVRSAKSPEALLDNWKMVSWYVDSHIRQDCRRLGGPA